MSNNVYGLDFLKSQHNLPDQGEPAAVTAEVQFRRSSSASVAVVPDVSHKTDLEKQSDVLIFLRHHRSSGCLPPSVIYKSLGIDLSDGGADSEVAKMLVNNPKVNVEEVPDPENPSGIPPPSSEANFPARLRRIGRDNVWERDLFFPNV